MFGALLRHESRDFPPGRDPPVPRKGMMLDGKFAPGDSLVCHPAGGELLIPSKKSVSGALSVVQGNQILGKGGQGTVCWGWGWGLKKRGGELPKRPCAAIDDYTCV